jgi:hypothetical protein
MGSFAAVKYHMLVFLQLTELNLDPVLNYMESQDIDILSIIPVIADCRDVYIVIANVEPSMAVWLNLY